MQEVVNEPARGDNRCRGSPATEGRSYSIRPESRLTAVRLPMQAAPDRQPLYRGEQMRLLRRPLRLSVIAVLSGLILAALSVSASADTSLPVNYVSVNFAPITTTTSSNYNWATGALTPGTAS